MNKTWDQEVQEWEKFYSEKLGVIDEDQLLKVNETIEGAHPLHPKYPLLPGDVLTQNRDGTYTKHTGIAIVGFTLTEEQAGRLEPVGGQIVMM